MSEQSVLLRFKTEALDRARATVKVISATLQQGAALAKETRRELQAQLREGRGAVKALTPLGREANRLRKDLTRRAEAVSGARAVEEGASFEQNRRAVAAGVKGAKVVGALANGLPTAGAALGLLPQAAVVVLAKQVWDLLKGDLDKRLQAQQRDVTDLLTQRLAELRETEEERARRDPQFAGMLDRRAGRELEAQRARERRLGLAAGGGDAVVFGAGD